MDNTTIDKLISLNIQMEGVLRVLKDRQSPEAEDTFYALIDSFNALLSEAPAQPEPEVAPQEHVAEEVVQEEVYEVPQAPDTEEFVQDEEEEVVTEEEEVPAPAEPEEEEEEDAPTHEPVQYTPQEPSHIPTIQSELRVDEMIMRRDARELRKAFTLNDKFRFRRELFGNNDVQFAETLNMLEAMNSMEEANLYLTDDLGWDPENEHVKDFIAIVENHFANF